MVLYAHADGIDENCDHDASVEVFALHDLPQLQPGAVANVLACYPRAAAPVVLVALPSLPALLFVTGTNPLPIGLLHGSIVCFILFCANRTDSIGE